MQSKTIKTRQTKQHLKVDLSRALVDSLVDNFFCYMNSTCYRAIKTCTSFTKHLIKPYSQVKISSVRAVKTPPGDCCCIYESEYSICFPMLASELK